MSRPQPHQPRTRGKQFVLVFSAAAAFFIFPFGCGPKPTTQPTSAPSGPPPPQTRTVDPPGANDADINLTKLPGKIHLVQQGETLYSLAEKYYGNKKDWRKIWTANRNRLTNPNDLPVGMKLIIPP